MLDKFKQAGEMAKMAKQARQMQKQMEKEKVVLEENGIKVVINGTQKIESFEINGVSNDAVVEVLNKAIRKSQEAAAKQMQEMAGGLGGLMKGMM